MIYVNALLYLPLWGLAWVLSHQSGHWSLGASGYALFGVALLLLVSGMVGYHTARLGKAPGIIIVAALILFFIASAGFTLGSAGNWVLGCAVALCLSFSYALGLGLQMRAGGRHLA